MIRHMVSLSWLTALGFVVSLSTPLYSQQPNASAQAEAQAQSAAALKQLNSYLNRIGYSQLATRAQSVAALRTKAEADARQVEVRRKIIELVGGLPPAKGSVKVKTFGSFKEDGFRVENIAYESLPGYWVTANVYVPEGRGPFPAMVIAPGHGTGKASQYAWAANFARAGLLTLAIDPMGQGERMQHFDAELGVSKVEPSGEHEHANQSALLIGQHIARYWFADGIRSVDYLTQRRDVDAKHIGTFGCSGGGTAATYLAAMDPRIAVAVASSYITSFKELLPGNGPQDAEQTLPRFLASGLDFADWVELAAPRPFAIVAFDEDFFPLAGAKWTYQEARGFYSLYGAEDNLLFINGPGGHCNLGPVSSQVLNFLIKHLKGAKAEVPTFVQYRPKDPDELTVTPTGQLSTSIGGHTLEALVRADAQKIIASTRVLTSPADLLSLQSQVRRDIRAQAAVVAAPGDIARVTRVAKEEREGYRLERITLESLRSTTPGEVGITLDCLIAIPLQTTEPRALIIWMDPTPNERTAASPDFVRLVKAGHVVMAFQPRGVLGEPPPNPTQLALGRYMQPLLRSIAVGTTLIGMRVDDTIMAITWLRSRPDINSSSIILYGKGGLGMVALHAAALDTRITEVVIENTLVSYRMALEAGLHKNLSELVVPGILKHYDVGDLLEAISPRSVLIINPVNAMGLSVPTNVVAVELGNVFKSDSNLGTPQRIRILKRGFRDPLPLE